MSTFSDRLALIITADTRGAVQGLEKVGTTAEKELSKAQASLDRTGRNLTRFGVGAIATGAVVGAGLYKAAQAYDAAHKSALLLANTIRNQPALAGANQKALEGLAQSIQHKTAADGDEIVAGMAKLGMYGANEEALKSLTPLVVDYARKTGKDLVSAFADVGKALQGKTKALVAAGVQIDANTYASDRLKAITDGLRTSVGDFAENELKGSLSAQLEQARNNAGDLAEGLGKGVVQAISDVTGGLDDLTQGSGLLGEDQQAGIGRWATYAVAASVAGGAVSVVAGQVIKAKDALGAGYERLQQWVGGLEAGTNRSGKLVSALGGVEGAIGVVGLAAVAGTAIYQHYADEKRRAQEITDAFAEALKREKDEAGSVNQVILDQLQSGTNFLGMLRDSGVSVAPFVAAVNDGGKALQDLGSWFGHAGNQTDEFVYAVDNGKIPASKLNLALVELAKSGAMNDEEFDAFVRRLAQLGGAQNQAVNDAKDQEYGQKQLGIATEDTTGKIDQQATAQDKLGKAQTDAIGAAFAYRDASDAVAQAEQDKADATEAAADKIVAADRSLADAHRQVDDANADLAESYRGLDQAARDYQERVDGLKDSIEGGEIAKERASIAVTKAEKALAEAQASQDPEKIRDADLDLREARLQLKRTSNDLTDAQDELNQARRDGVEKSPEMEAAEKRVKEARDRQKDATDKLRDAEDERVKAAVEGAKGVEDASKKVEAALQKQAEAYLIDIALARILRQEQQSSGVAPPVSTVGGQHSPPVNGPESAPSGGRSAVGGKGMTVIVNVDGTTQTTRDAIHRAAEKGAKRGAVALQRRFAA